MNKLKAEREVYGADFMITRLPMPLTEATSNRHLRDGAILVQLYSGQPIDLYAEGIMSGLEKMKEHIPDGAANARGRRLLIMAVAADDRNRAGTIKAEIVWQFAGGTLLVINGPDQLDYALQTYTEAAYARM